MAVLDDEIKMPYAEARERHLRRYFAEKKTVRDNQANLKKLYEQDRGRSKDVNFISDKYYSPNYLLSHFPKYKIFVTLGSRGRGKTYSGKRLLLNRFLDNENKKFAWLRLTEGPINHILENDGNTFFEQTLLEKKNVDIKTSNSDIYMKKKDSEEWVLRGKAMSIQKYGSWKGNQFEDYNLIIMDELVRAQSEKKTFNVPGAFVNMLENICRERQDIMVLIYANTIDEMQEIRDLFGFMPFPGQYGVYKLYHKRTIIEYLDDSYEWKKKKRETIAGRLAENIGEFQNTYQTMLDSTRTWLIARSKIKKKYLMSVLIAKNYIVHIHQIGDGLYYVDYPTYTKGHVKDQIYPIRRRFVGPQLVFSQEAVDFIKRGCDAAKFRFSDLKLVGDWFKYLEAYGIIV